MAYREYWATAGYRWTNEDAQIIGPILAELGPNPKPQEVVDLADDPRSPLHRFFPWDNAVAANEHRKQIARSMIRSIRIEVTTRSGESRRVPAWYSLTVTSPPPAEEKRRQYVSYQVIRESPSEAALLKAAMLTELHSLRERFERSMAVFDGLEMFEPVVEAIRRLEEAEDGT